MIKSVYFAEDSPKRILVTGDTGMIGRELTRRLKAQPGNEVTGLSTVAGRRIDLQDKWEIRQALKKQPFDIIYHLAALNPFKSNQGVDYFKSNVQGTENLLESILELKKEGRKIPDVFIASSALVYEPEKISLKSFQDQVPLQEDSLNATLDDALRKSPAAGRVSESLLDTLKISKSDIYYNDSKLIAEMTARHYAKRGIPIKIGRLVNCYGKQSNQLINQLLTEKKNGQPLSLQGKDSQARDYLFCDGDSSKDDIARLIQAVAEKGKPGETYNISSEGRFVRTPQAIANSIARTGAFEAPDTQGYRVVLSNQKLKSLGVEPPKTSPEEGIQILSSDKKQFGPSGIFSKMGDWLGSLLKTIQLWLQKLCFWQKPTPAV